MHNPCRATCTNGQGSTRGGILARVLRSRPTFMHWQLEWPTGSKATMRVSSKLRRESPLYAPLLPYHCSVKANPSCPASRRVYKILHNCLLRRAPRLCNPGLHRFSIPIGVLLEKICLPSSTINHGSLRELDISSGGSGGECLHDRLYS